MFKLAFNISAIVDWLIAISIKKCTFFKANIIAELIVLYTLAKVIPSQLHRQKRNRKAIGKSRSC